MLEYHARCTRCLATGLLIAVLLGHAPHTADAVSVAVQTTDFRTSFGHGWTNARLDPTDARLHPERVLPLLRGLGLPDATAERLAPRILNETGRRLLISDTRVRDLDTGLDFEGYFNMTFGANGIVFAMYSALGGGLHAMGELFEEDGYFVGLMHDCGNLVLLTAVPVKNYGPLPDFSKPALKPTRIPVTPPERPPLVPPIPHPEPKYPPFPPQISTVPLPGGLGLLLSGLVLLLLNARRK